MPRVRTQALGGLAIAALVATGAAAAPTATGHSGWEWVTPTPTGVPLVRLAVSGATVYAVGDDGTLLRSDDQGGTWRGLASRTSAVLSDVSATSPETVTFAGSCAVGRSRDGAANVTLLSVLMGPACGGAYFARFTPDGLNGFIISTRGTVLTTADGGVSLSRRTSLPAAPNALEVQSPTTALVVSGGRVLRTTDTGNTWTTVGEYPGRTIVDITSAGGDDMFASGGNALLRSSDAGQTWTAVDTPASPPWWASRISCAGPDLCLATLLGSPQVLRITAGGTRTQTIVAASRILQDVRFVTPTRAVAVGDRGTIVVSDDAGLTWRPVSASLSSPVQGIWARGASAVGVGREGLIVRTLDAGATWGEVGLPSANPAAAAAFPTATTGYAVDSAGIPFVTQDGGASWRVLPSRLGSATRGLQAPNAATVVIHSTTRIVRSGDGGRTFREVVSPLRGQAIRGMHLSRGVLVLVGRSRLYRSANGGRSWTRIPLPRVQIRDASCTGGRACWLLTSRQAVLVTTNGGRRWTNVTAATGAYGRGYATAIVGDGARTAYLVGRGGTLARTRDGGASWAPQRVSREGLRRVVASPGTAFALTLGGDVLRTLTAGESGTRTRLTLRVRPGLRPRRMVVSGRLMRAVGGEAVRITSTRGERVQVVVASDGTFSTTRVAPAGTGYVAQWEGDGARNGVGTRVTYAPRRR